MIIWQLVIEFEETLIYMLIADTSCFQPRWCTTKLDISESLRPFNETNVIRLGALPSHTQLTRKTVNLVDFYFSPSIVALRKTNN